MGARSGLRLPAGPRGWVEARRGERATNQAISRPQRARAGFRRRNSRTSYALALTKGALVGAVVPPARSIVTATTAFRGTLTRRWIVALLPPANSPAGLGAPPFG